MKENEAMGARLHAARKARDMSMVELSMKSGVSQSQVSTVERGKADPSTSTVKQLAQALDVSVLWLITGTGPMSSDTDDCPTAYSKLKEEHEQLLREVDRMMIGLEVLKDAMPDLKNLNLENLRPGRSKIAPEPAKDRESVSSKKRRVIENSPKATEELVCLE